MTEEPVESPSIGMTEAESILLGNDPTEHWTPEQREKVADIMAALDKPIPVAEPDLRDLFKPGERIRDQHQKLTTLIRTVGKDSMTVSVIGRRVKWAIGHTFSVAGQAFIVLRAKKNDATLEHLGKVLKGYMPDGAEVVNTTNQEVADGQK